MATTTLKTLKNYFARGIGKEDYRAVDSIGVDFINDAHIELSSRSPFESNKKSASLSVAVNLATLPTDFDYAHENEVKVYSYSGTTKYEYVPVPFDEVTKYPTSYYVYAFDHENDKVKTNQTTATLTIDYYAIPALMSLDSATTKFPIPRAIGFLAAGHYFEGVEGGEKLADRRLTQAEQLYSQAVTKNKINLPPKGMRSWYDDDEFLSSESILATQR